MFSIFYYLIFSGEFFFDPEKYVFNLKNKNKEYLLGFLLDESSYKYVKLRTISIIDRQNIISLGSSRVLQFREKMFEGSFYNAGYAIESIEDFELFISLLPEDKLPTILIIGLDQWMFNENYDDLRNPTKIQSYINFKKDDFEKFYQKINLLYGMFNNGKIEWRKWHDGPEKTIGLNARLKSSGFRNDGSKLYGQQIENLINQNESAFDYQFIDTYDRISKGRSRFQPFPKVNESALEILEKFLLYCREKNIHVVSFLPPYATDIFNKMIDTGEYSALNALPLRLEPVFDKYRFEFYDFSSFKFFGASDREAIDGFHGSEKVYTRILIEMLEKGSALNSFCDLPELRTYLKNSINDFYVF